MTFKLKERSLTAACVLALWVSTAVGQTTEPPENLKPTRGHVTGNVVPVQRHPDFAQFTGKLSFKVGTSSHYCSGLFVEKDWYNGIDELIVLTAAHCVQDNTSGAMYTDFKFEKEGGGDFELMNNCIRLPAGWQIQKDQYVRIKYDYAFLKVKATGNTNVPDMKFKLAAAAKPIGTDIKAYGYPATAGQLTAIAGNAAWDVLHPEALVFATESKGFTQGTSGGAWVRVQGSGPEHRVISVNSSYAIPFYDTQNIRIYGPNLNGQQPQDLLDAAVKCGRP